MAELPAEDCPRGPVCTEGQEFEVQFLRAGATSSQNRFLVRPFLMSVLEWRSPVAQDQPARRHRRQLQPATGPQLEAEMGGEQLGEPLLLGGAPYSSRAPSGCRGVGVSCSGRGWRRGLVSSRPASAAGEAGGLWATGEAVGW